MTIIIVGSSSSSAGSRAGTLARHDATRARGADAELDAATLTRLSEPHTFVYRMGYDSSHNVLTMLPSRGGNADVAAVNEDEPLGAPATKKARTTKQLTEELDVVKSEVTQLTAKLGELEKVVAQLVGAK